MNSLFFFSLDSKRSAFLNIRDESRVAAPDIIASLATVVAETAVFARLIDDFAKPSPDSKSLPSYDFDIISFPMPMPRPFAAFAIPASFWMFFPFFQDSSSFISPSLCRLTPLTVSPFISLSISEDDKVCILIPWEM